VRDPSSLVTVARITKTHGLRGEVVLDLLSDVEGRIENTDRFFLIGSNKQVSEVEVETRRYFKDRHVLKFVGIESRTEADNLRGSELAIPEEEIGELPTDHFYIHELVGLTVKLKDGKIAGEVKRVVQTAGVDLLELNNGSLIPFASHVCLEVDLEKKEIIIEPPEGLLELNAR